MKTSGKIYGRKTNSTTAAAFVRQRRIVLAYLAIIYEFQGFDSVKKVLRYTFIFLLVSTSICLAQRANKGNSGAVTTALNFADSIRIVLENTRNVDATVIGGSFFSAWSGFGLDQQQTIQRQTALMKKKKFPLRPHMVDYFGALPNAVSTEHAEGSKIDGFLKVAAKVIELEKPDKARSFFNSSKVFFQAHALHFEKSSRVYARDDEYSFDYIEPAPVIAWDDTTNIPVQESTPQDNPYDDIAPSSDSVYQDAQPEGYDQMPGWVNPTPVPNQEGAVIRFSRITLGLVTRYDSVFLKNTKGIYSLRDNVFVGEGGTFDWSPAGLSPDSVIATFSTYFFTASKNELKADMVKLNYIGRTPGPVAGSFEYKSQARKDSVDSTYPRFKSFQSNIAIQGIGDANVQYRGGFSLVGKKISSASVSGEKSRIDVYHNGEKKFEATSPEFFFTDSTIAANKTHINIIHGNDSIVHKTVRMKYFFGNDSTQRLYLQKDKGDMRHTPYSSSFFNVDFAADVVQWDLYSDSLNVLSDGGRNTVPVIIESTDFYDPEDFRLLKGDGFSFHPLALFANYGLKNRTREYYLGDLVASTKRNYAELRKAAEFLSQKGMIEYDPKSDKVKLKKKTTNFYLAQKGEIDYDNL